MIKNEEKLNKGKSDEAIGDGFAERLLINDFISKYSNFKVVPRLRCHLEVVSAAQLIIIKAT